MIVFFLTLALSFACLAQTAEPPPAPAPPVSDAQWELQPPPMPPPPHSPVRLWMERLKEKDAAEYERLIRLLDENPPRFHEEVRHCMMRERYQLVLQRYPAVWSAIENLSAEERDKLFSDLARPWLPPPPPPGPPPEGPGHERFRGRWSEQGPPAAAKFADDPVRQRLRTLHRRYLGEHDPQKREAIRAEIRKTLQELYQQRIVRRREYVLQIQDRLRAAQKNLEELEAQANDWAERKLEEFTRQPDAETEP